MTSIDSSVFRSTLGHVPTPVTVVTGLDSEGRPVGLTIGSFSSISLDPALVGFFVGVGSSTWPRMAERGSFCVNVLAEGQEDLCWRFAKEPPTQADSRFDGVTWQPGPTGSPVLDGVVAWIDCDVHSVTEVGDHAFVVGRVRDLGHADVAAGESRDAMTFYRGQVSGTGPRA